jgi:PIN domain nuclease of toxin-antitoxin system
VIYLLDLPATHKDPIDRTQVAQAKVEGFVLLTADLAMADYGAPVELV